MELKRFQRRVLEEVEAYLRAVEAQRAGGNARYATRAAWEDQGLGPYHDRRNGLGEDFPHFCVKVPTGGGKTLLATQILGAAHRTLFKDRNGAGLVLWVVPSSQIYRDTLKRLRDRSDLYRVMLEHAVSRRIEVWEKQQINRLSPARLRDCLNILVIQLASTNRQTKEDLKFARDSGGSITEHFPPETDYPAHQKLKADFKNLDMLVDDPARGQHLVKTSIANLVRICRPIVILDEGHKAASPLARQTIEDFNASLVVELSATPRTAKIDNRELRPNILSRVSGRELLDEEMIKLPLNIASSGQKNWKDVITQARDRRELLARKADMHAQTAGPARQIRPMVLVQVERTGKDQREAGFVHADDVKQYLIQTLGVPDPAVKIKSADLDELSDVDNLMDPLCPVQWIITKAALQEGWDCPFAYILVSLNNTGSATGMTQLVGRVLRQPYQERLPESASELNESYVYCLHLRAGQLSASVKKALEQEGLEDASHLVRESADSKGAGGRRAVAMWSDFAGLYAKPHAGKIYLPHFCVKTAGKYEPLDYYRHLVSAVDVDRFPYDQIDWPMAQALADAKDRFYRISLDSELSRENETEARHLEDDNATRAWIVASLRHDCLSHKQIRRVVGRVCDRLQASELSLAGRLSLVKFIVRDRIELWLQEQLDEQTKTAFLDIHAAGRLMFYLECAECRFEIPRQIMVRAGRPIMHDNGDRIAKSLFESVSEESVNPLERSVALCLDRDERVLWWYRNIVGPDSYHVQGYLKQRVHPDFVAQSVLSRRPERLVWVLESKGAHLKGNDDTNYKRDLARYFREVGRKVSWQQLGDEFIDHQFFFHVLDENPDEGGDWKDQLKALLQ